jgi:hypothetical protein
MSKHRKELNEAETHAVLDAVVRADNYTRIEIAQRLLPAGYKVVKATDDVPHYAS